MPKLWCQRSSFTQSSLSAVRAVWSFVHEEPAARDEGNGAPPVPAHAPSLLLVPCTLRRCNAQPCHRSPC